MAVDPRFFENARTFITETMQSVIPNANVDGGSGINAVLGRGAATISAALLQEIEHLLTTRDLTDPEALSEEDMDLLLENLLTARDGGDLAFGFVRLYYPDRVLREFSSGLTATTQDGTLNFVTLADLSFQPQDYFIDSDNGDFYINVPFTAEEAGEEYNIDPGEITELSNDQSGASRVTNIDAFRNGKPPQTNTQALRKARRAISTRTPLSKDGVIFFFQELYGSRVQDILVVGAGDDEMLRDEVWDMGEGAEPRFQVGVDSLNSQTREQMGTRQSLFVGGRTDVYTLYTNVNFIQKNIDIFADMALDSSIDAAPSGVSTIQATFIPGTTGTIDDTGKLIIDLGNTGEETLAYSSVVNTPAGSGTYVFTLVGETVQAHDAGATVKAVNNNDLTVGPGESIDVLPVFQIADISLLDPVTFQTTGSPLPQTRPESRLPGWYVTRTNPYDLLSAKETKSIVIDEKRERAGNQYLSVTGGVTSDVVVGGGTYTQYEVAPGTDFTDYEGREIVLSGGASTTRTIIQVVSQTQVILSGSALGALVGVNGVIEEAFGDYNQFPVRVNYYTNTEIGEAQSFLDQDSRRILAGDILSRAFLPVFLDFTLRYRGSGNTTEIRDAINLVLQTSSGDALGESTGAKFEYSDLINAPYTDGLANYVETPFQIRIRRQQLDGSFSVDYINPNRNTVANMAVLNSNGVTFFAADGSGAEGTSTFNSSSMPFTGASVGEKIFISGVGLAKIVSFANVNQVELDITFESDFSGADWSFPVFFLTARLPSGDSRFSVPTEGRLLLGGFTSNQESVTYSSFVADGNDQYTFIVTEGQSINLPHLADEPLRVCTLDYDDANVITDGVITDERTYRPFLGDVVIEQL